MWLYFLNLRAITNSFSVLIFTTVITNYLWRWMTEEVLLAMVTTKRCLAFGSINAASAASHEELQYFLPFSGRLQLSRIQALSWMNQSYQDNYVLVSELIIGAQGIVICDWSNLESIGNKALTSLVCGKRGHIVQNETNTVLPLSPRQPEHQEEQSTKFLWSQWH